VNNHLQFRLPVAVEYSSSRQVVGSVQSPIQWLLAVLASAETPNPASIGVDNIVLLTSMYECIA
jgi:hypothetical protein